MDEEDVGVGHRKFTRCIVCNSYTTTRQCYNIFSTKLDNDDIALSEFLKNVLGCAVLIIIPPDFFLCKSCYTLCSELDYSLARCNKLQRRITSLFQTSRVNQEAIYNGSEPVEVKLEPEEDEEFYDGEQELLEVNCEDEIPREETDLLQTDLQETELVDIKLEPQPEEEAFVDESSQLIEDGIFWEPQQEIFYEDVLENDDINEEIVETMEDNSESAVSIAGDSKKVEEELYIQNEISSPAGQQEYTSVQDLLGMIWFCKPCKMKFSNLEALKKHKKSDTCNSNSKNFVIKSAYEYKNYTVKLKKKQKVFYCNYCTFEAPTAESMEKHVVSHKSDPPLMCDVCGRRFKTRSTFKRHQLVHDESRPFACKFCTFRSETELTLRIHQRMHDDKKKFSCSKCGYKTIRKMSYISHLRTHTGERPYCCPDCPYRSKDSSTLIRHRRTHGGLKRYHCTVCDYKALQKNSLTRHMMIHTGEKPHTCPHCDYSSTMKHNLADHIAAKHCTEKPFACNMCNYKTKAKRLLKYHMRIHSGEKPFACTKCDFRVRHRAGLSYHMKTKHPPDGQPRKVILKFVHHPGDNIQFSDEEEEEYELNIVDTDE